MDGPPLDAEVLFAQVHGHLQSIARRQMASERDGHTLQPTALVNEAWLRLLGSAGANAPDRATFLATAARAMRQVLIDHARSRGRRKRAGGARRLPEDLMDLAVACDLDDVLAVDEALLRLAEHDPRAARVVELRFFSGIEVREIADLLAISERTIERDWAYARAWLFRALDGCGEGSR